MIKNKIQKFSLENSKLLKKYGYTLTSEINFPQSEVPALGTLAIWLLKRCGAIIKLRVVETKKQCYNLLIWQHNNSRPPELSKAMSQQG